MSHAHESEEIDRFMVSIAAESLGGGRKNVSYLGAIVPEGRRTYFYARPAEDGVHFSIDRLEHALDETGFPHLVDWSRTSERHGLRYGSRLMDVPEKLLGFAGKEAEAEWRAWRAEMLGEQGVLTTAAFAAVGHEAPVSLSSEMTSANLSIPSTEMPSRPRQAFSAEPKERMATDGEIGHGADRIDSGQQDTESEKNLRQERIREQALRITARAKERGTPPGAGRGERSEGR